MIDLPPGAEGVGATTTRRRKRLWQDGSHRDLPDKKYACVWANGVHFNIRLADDP